MTEDAVAERRKLGIRATSSLLGTERHRSPRGRSASRPASVFVDTPQLPRLRCPRLGSDRGRGRMSH